MSDWSHIRDEIKARLRLSEIVGRKVLWDRRKSSPGRGEFWACCPFHNEKSASFHVLDREGYYKCFGCGAGGDVVEFVIQAENRSYREAMEMLAEEAGVELPRYSPEIEKRENERKTLHEVLERAAAFFEEALRLSGGEAARAYLKKRGLASDIVKEFRLGYWPDGGHALIDHLKSQGIAEEQMRAAGLLSKNEEEARDLMRHRLIFPIADGRGRVIAFGGRALRDEQQPKYLNSPDTELFHKGRTLYNFARARAKSGAKGQSPVTTQVRRQALIVAEGYMDVIALARAGLRAAAPLGTALTEDQLQLLWSVEEEPVICFDGDAAGLAAAGRALERALPLLRPGRTLKFAVLPPGQDPDDLLKTAGAEALRHLLEGARPLAETYWDLVTGRCDLTTPDGKARAEAALLEGLRRIGDPQLRRHYEAFVRGRIGEWFRAPRSSTSPVRAAPGAKPRPSAELRARLGRGGVRPSAGDETLVLAILTHPEIAQDLIEEIGAVKLSSLQLDELRREALRLIARGAVSSGALLEELDRADVGTAARRLIEHRSLQCLPCANPAATREAARQSLFDVMARLAASADASETREALKSALTEGISQESWAEARALHDQRRRTAPRG